MGQKAGNLFAGIAEHVPQEIFETLLETGDFRIERIVSQGQSTPQGEWLEQKQDEWVVLLSGAATLCFKSDKSMLNMKPGDHVHIPAHCKHRVEWTDPNAKTVWLAVHYEKQRIAGRVTPEGPAKMRRGRRGTQHHPPAKKA